MQVLLMIILGNIKDRRGQDFGGDFAMPCRCQLRLVGIKALGGSGMLDVKANEASCKDEAGLCSSGYFSIGAQSDGNGGVKNRCCKLELQ